MGQSSDGLGSVDEVTPDGLQYRRDRIGVNFGIGEIERTAHHPLRRVREELHRSDRAGRGEEYLRVEAGERGEFGNLGGIAPGVESHTLGAVVYYLRCGGGSDRGESEVKSGIVCRIGGIEPQSLVSSRMSGIHRCDSMGGQLKVEGDAGQRSIDRIVDGHARVGLRPRHRSVAPTRASSENENSSEKRANAGNHRERGC